MMTIGADCVWCKRLHIGSKLRTCDAFPDGIPHAIVMSKHNHREPFAGDNGLLFDPNDDFEPEDSRFYTLPGCRR